MTNGGVLKVKQVQGEIRYLCRHRAYSLAVDPASSTTHEDARLRVSTSFSANRLSVHVQALDAIKIEAFVLFFDESFHHAERFFLNGYQSWTDSREFSAQERIDVFPPLVRPLLERFFRTNHYGDYDILPSAGCHLHGFTYFYVRRGKSSVVDFCGSLSEAEGFTIFRVLPEDRRVIVQKDCDGLTLSRGDVWKAFDLHVESGDEEAIFSNYFLRCYEISGLKNRSTPSCTGWTSWYYHYTNITETIILENLNAFTKARIPIDVFQIDDGWQAAVGDWLEVNAKFPNGLRAIVDRIHDAGYKAGLWLAPLVAERKSRLLADHPEWLLRDSDGNPVPAGNSNLWSGDFYGLDIYHEGFRTYLAQVFDSILNEWGFDLVKLDFLYGACLTPGNGKTRGTKMVDTMDLLRRLVGEKWILGCGVPIGPAIGRVDICRIGPDVGHEWTNTLTRGLAMRETISTVTALENAIGRRHLSGRAFSNDPDVFFLRNLSFDNEKFDPFVAVQELRWGKRIPLTQPEKYSLFLLNNIFGKLVFTSDNIDEYSDDTRAFYLSSFPLREKEDLRVKLVGPSPAFGELGGCYEVQFRIGSLRYWVYANLANDAVSITLPVDGFSRDERRHGHFHKRGDVQTIQPHESLCVLEESAGDVVLLGSEGHLFPGSEIVQWAWDGAEGLSIVRDERARGSGRMILKVPPEKPGLNINGQFVPVVSCLGREHLVVLNWD